MSTSQISGTETYTFARGDGDELALDVFRPVGPHRRCGVVVVHGGGWRAGAKESVHDRAGALAEHGFTTFAVDYRLLGAAPWPAQLDDVGSALTWVRDNAGQFDIDPARLAIQGHSAGGHLALMSGLLPPDVRPAAIVAYYPPIGFHRAARPQTVALRPETFVPDDIGRLPSWMLLPDDASDDDLRSAGPIDRIGSDFPPTLLVHGGDDSAVVHASSLHLFTALTKLGIPCGLNVYPGRGHEFDRAPTMLATTSAAAGVFLESYVTDRERIEAEAARYPFPPTS